MVSDPGLTVTLPTHPKGLSHPLPSPPRSLLYGGRLPSHPPILSLSPLRRPKAGFSHLTSAKVPFSPRCSMEGITWAAEWLAGDSFPS